MATRPAAHPSPQILLAFTSGKLDEVGAAALTCAPSLRHRSPTPDTSGVLHFSVQSRRNCLVKN